MRQVWALEFLYRTLNVYRARKQEATKKLKLFWILFFAIFNLTRQAARTESQGGVTVGGYKKTS
jgi:hypothetical protein